MSQFNNSPRLADNADGQVKRYVHQPLTIEHYGLHAKIQENGRVLITGQPVKAGDGQLEYDEVDVPASLIFKLATLLKATRTIKFVSVASSEASEVADKE